MSSLCPFAVEIIMPTIHANDELLDACCRSINDTYGLPVTIAEGGSFAENCNRAAFDSDTDDFVVFLNDDTLPQGDWLTPLLMELAANDDVGIAGSRLIYPDGRIQHAGIWFDAPGGVLTAHNRLEDVESCDVDAVTGAALAIRRSLFRDCEGFDEQFRNGYEDVDLCLRVRAGGWRIRYCAESTLIHYESQSGPARWTHVNENVQRLQELWNVRTD